MTAEWGLQWDQREDTTMLKNFRERRAIAKAGQSLRAYYSWRRPGA